MKNIEAIFTIINTGNIAEEIKEVVNEISSHITKIENFRYNSPFITVEKFFKTYSVRKNHFDNKGISYNGMKETLEYLSKRKQDEILSIAHFVSLSFHYIVLFETNEDEANSTIIGFFSWKKNEKE